MKELLLCLLACTLAGAWAGTLILLLKKLLKDRLSPLWHCYVWLVVMALLLIPLPTVTRAETIPNGEILFVESDPTYVPEQELRETELVVEQEIRESAPVVEQETAHSVPTTEISQISQTPVEKSAGEESVSVSENKSVEKSVGFAFRFVFPDWGWTVLGLLWLGGAVFFLSNHLLNYRRFVSKLNHTSCPAKEATLRLLKETEEELGIRHPVELAVTLLPITPMIVGLRNPTLYLPEEELSEEQMKLIFIHELCHYKYGDLYYKELATILRSVHWFNPLCAVMVEDIDFSCELLCDRRVTKQIGAGRSREYSALLLELLGVSIRRSNPSATFSMDKTALKRRLSLIMKPNNTSKALCMLLTAALLLTGAACSAAVAPEIQVEEPTAKIEMPEQGEKIAELKAQNNDVVGWLQIPDTEIDNAVMHTTDNETYHRKDELMHYSESSCYFADYEYTFGPTSDDLGRSTL
ncbi:MAG: hypothetical protein IJ411_05370, partial [Oscillospiraceae bacterium]|nr:hypothetical protein [Oscillospiraceae bacterium]